MAMLHLFSNYYSGMDHADPADRMHAAGRVEAERGEEQENLSGAAAAAAGASSQWSGLPRLIQTVGTPFGGTPIMDNINKLPKGWFEKFFYGCTYVHDLTQDGGVQWLATIPGKARQAVTYSKLNKALA
jgi:hypothetical protein